MQKYMSAIFLCIVLLSAVADACNLRIRNMTGRQNFQGSNGFYDPFDASEYIQAITFNVRKTGGGCDYFVTLETGQSGNFSNRELERGGDILNYNVYVDANKTHILKAQPTATANEVISGTFTGGGTQIQSHTIYWLIDPLQNVPYRTNTYRDRQVALSVYEGSLTGSNNLDHQRNINFHALVENSVDVSLVDSGAPFNINDTHQTVDFGILESGETEAFDFVVRANNGYSITLQSENNERMVHVNPAVADVVGYDFRVGGNVVNLSSGVPVEVVNESNPPSGGYNTHSALVTVESFVAGDTVAGTYSDNVIVTISAN